MSYAFRYDLYKSAGVYLYSETFHGEEVEGERCSSLDFRKFREENKTEPEFSVRNFSKSWLDLTRFSATS